MFHLLHEYSSRPPSLNFIFLYCAYRVISPRQRATVKLFIIYTRNPKTTNHKLRTGRTETAEVIPSITHVRPEMINARAPKMAIERETVLAKCLIHSFEIMQPNRSLSGNFVTVSWDFSVVWCSYPETLREYPTGKSSWDFVAGFSG